MKLKKLDNIYPEIEYKVYNFINSLSKETTPKAFTNYKVFDKFINFLRTSKLPLYERWMFYYLAKYGDFYFDSFLNDSDPLTSVHRDLKLIYFFNPYGIYSNPYFYHWIKYWETHSPCKEEFEYLVVSDDGNFGTGQDITGYELIKAQLNKDADEGWDYVLARIMEEKREQEKQEVYKSKSYKGDSFDANYDENYCTACQENPCMCSDREATSTTFD